MSKKFVVVALVLLLAALMSSNAFAAAIPGCTTGVNPVYIAVGSSGQFNTFAYAAQDILLAAGNGYEFWAGNNVTQLVDSRVNVNDTVKVWMAWDTQAVCNLYVYFSSDSTVGVKDFFAYTHITTPKAANVGSVYVNPSGTTWPACPNTTSPINAGLPVCTSTGTVPVQITTFLTTKAGPTSSTSKPQPHCGQTASTSTTFCFFNAGMADVRPEDTLYATTRALTNFASTTYVGLGYNSAVCGGSATLGCPFYTAMGTGSKFNVVKFALTGTDPIGKGTVPTYTTLRTGAAPVVVLASNFDSTTSSGFGYVDSNTGTYLYHDILRKVLALFYEGTLSCTGDVLPTAAVPCQSPDSPVGCGVGAGNPVQVLQREELSGTYNTFEFNAIRTMTGSSNPFKGQQTISATNWVSDALSSQEFNNYPALNYNSGSGCPAGGTTVPDGSTNCGDPLYQITTTSSSACGAGGWKARAIGTGELVNALVNKNAQQTSGSSIFVNDGLGYAFWGYGNVSALCAGQTSGSGFDTCSQYLGHYLTVDAIDPLFSSEGGADNGENVAGAYNLPQCNLKPTGTLSCGALPFTHIKDGKYPIWTLLGLVTFNQKTGQTIPPGVVAMVANAENEAGGGKNIDDFVPLLTNINLTTYTGDLNLGVLRSHYIQSAVNPADGISGCSGVFTGIPIGHNTSTASNPVCLGDAGGDVGGSVFTVQSVVDFNKDFGGTTYLNGKALPAAYGIYGLHQ